MASQSLYLSQSYTLLSLQFSVNPYLHLPWPPMASSLLSVTYNVQTPPPMDSNGHFTSQPTQVSLPPPPMASHGLQPSYCNIQCTSYIGDSSLGMVPLVSQGVVPLACGIIPHLLHLLTRGLVPDPQGMKGVVPLPGVIPHLHIGDMSTGLVALVPQGVVALSPFKT